MKKYYQFTSYHDGIHLKVGHMSRRPNAFYIKTMFMPYHRNPSNLTTKRGRITDSVTIAIDME